MSATLIVDAGAAEKRARRLFPSASIVSSMGLRADPPDLSPYKGAEIVLWCHSPDLLADQLSAVAAKISIVQGEKFIQEFNGNAEAVRHWLRANVRPYEPPTSISDPRATPDNIVAPAASGEAVGVSKPAATNGTAHGVIEAAVIKAKDDPGAMFEPTVVEALREMRRMNPAEYQRVRGLLKAGSATKVGELDRVTGKVVSIAEARTVQQAKIKPNPVDDYAPFADDAMARAFTAAHPELRYVARWGKWLEWQDSAGWIEDTTLKVYDLARKVCCAVADETRGSTPSQVAGAKSAGKRSAVESLARGDRVHAASPEQWDADRLVLNTPGGLVNLVNGSMRPIRMDDYCLKMAAATPLEGAPRWLEFLEQGTGGKPGLTGFLQRWAGYCATGLTREQKFLFLHGPGGSGKGTFLNTIAKVLGTYAKTIAMETLIESHNERHPEELARLVGARMAVASETQQGKRWNEARIKMITGEDSVNARLMRQDSFDFVPQVKLSLMGNHPPGLRSVDASMKRRLLIAPFDHVPAKPDQLLAEKLWAERDGILFWIVCGAIEWNSEGLKPPESVLKASADYFENQDMTGQWIGDKCDTDVPACHLESTIRTLYASYKPYCEAAGYQWLRQGELRDDLYSRGFLRGGYEKAPTVKGIRLKPEPPKDSGSRFAD